MITPTDNVFQPGEDVRLPHEEQVYSIRSVIPGYPYKVTYYDYKKGEDATGPLTVFSDASGLVSASKDN